MRPAADVPRLLVFLVLLVILLPLTGAGQQAASRPLTFQQIVDLVSLGAPDLTVHDEIGARGLAFVPDPALLASLRTKGAGPMTLADITALIPKASPRAEALSDLVYMPSHQGLGLIELNVADGKIQRTAKTSLFNNTFVSWNANRREFYVAANNGDAVSVIAADTFVETAAMKGDVGWNTYSTALSRDGRDLYLACSGAPTVRLVSFDTASRSHIATTVVSRGGTGDYLALSPDGGRLYVSSGSDLYEYQASGLRLLRQQTFAGWQTAPLAVSSDGQFLFALQRGGVVRARSNSLTTDKSIALPEAGSKLSLSTDGRYALAAGQDALYRVPLSMDTYTLIRPPRRTNWRFFEFAESSDGRALYVLSGGNGQESLWVIDLATRQVIKTVDGIPYPGSIISVPRR